MSDTKETAEFVFAKLEEYFDAVRHVIEQYGGDVAELGLNALRIQAASELLPGVFALLIALIVYKYVDPRQSLNTAREIIEENGDRYSNDQETLWYMRAAIGFVVPALAVFIAISKLFNAWAWTGIFYPELYAVHLFMLK